MNVLFVSEKDECRGPISRVLAQMHARDMDVPGAGFDSAGIVVGRASKPAQEVVAFLRDHGLNVSRHLSRPIAPAQIRWADLILCMTYSVADRVRDLLGPQRAGMVVVLNDAVGFGRTKAERDIAAVGSFAHRDLLTTYTRIKAATGKLVRRMSHGEDRPSAFGASDEVAGPEHYLDDPQLRQFLSRYIIEFIERAFEVPRTDDILEALTVLGRPLSLIDLEELIRTDLKGQVRQDEDRRWQIEEHVRVERARQRRDRVEQQRRREAEAEREQARRERERQERRRAPGEEESRRESRRDRARARAYSGGDNGDDESGIMTEIQAFAILTITAHTSRGEASRKYKQLLMRFHPDKFHDDDEFRVMAEKKTKRINLAWSLVKDRLPGKE